MRRLEHHRRLTRVVVRAVAGREYSLPGAADAARSSIPHSSCSICSLCGSQSPLESSVSSLSLSLGSCVVQLSRHCRTAACFSALRGGIADRRQDGVRGRRRGDEADMPEALVSLWVDHASHASCASLYVEVRGRLIASERWSFDAVSPRVVAQGTARGVRGTECSSRRRGMTSTSTSRSTS